MYSGKKMNNIEMIIEQARELSQMMEKSDIAHEYYESINKMQQDGKAQQLLSKLIILGRELNDAISAGDEGKVTGGAEAELLREEIENNDLVKNYILAQKNYVNLIKLVQERIKNPVEKANE
jgi:cell fate (sporulation/competence/biofilm development) regulator YlbF (YheA/YmcA/DUF963 family)